MSYENFFWANTSVAPFLVLNTERNVVKKGINVIDVQIT